MFSYVAYGLVIESTLRLPELVVSEADADVVIREGRVDHMPSGRDDAGVGFCATMAEVCYFLEGVGAFSIRDGREIIIDAAPGVEERVLRLFILGRVLATLLHQRQLLVLHASAVRVNGGVVAFLGGKGWGKSTLAAAMCADGHGIIADDIVALNTICTERPEVFPGFPQLKLWPDAAVSLGEDPERLPRLHPQLEKRAHCVAHEFPHIPLPLKRIYILAEGTKQAIQPLHRHEAFVEMVRHSFLVHLLEATGTAAAHFRQCASLVDAIRICRLQRQRSLAALPELVKFVVEDVG